LLKKLFFVVVVALLTGCAEHTMRITPEIAPHETLVNPIGCTIHYDGNTAYLPSSIIQNSNNDCQIRYSYTIHYVNGNTDWDGLNLFNPLIFVGFPMSQESVIVEGKLEWISPSKENQIFTASCIATKTRNLFQTGGSSEPRKECLFAIRDNINSQLIHLNKE
jgi:hypothetical protein